MAKKEDKIPEDIDSELKAPKFGKANTHTTTGYFLDVNESDTITVDPDLGKETISTLGKHFKLEYAQNLVFPKLYSCPSGVLRDTNGINYGISDKLSPVAGAAIDGIFNLEKLSPQEIKKSRA